MEENNGKELADYGVSNSANSSYNYYASTSPYYSYSVSGFTTGTTTAGTYSTNSNWYWDKTYEDAGVTKASEKWDDIKKEIINEIKEKITKDDDVEDLIELAKKIVLDYVFSMIDKPEDFCKNLIEETKKKDEEISELRKEVKELRELVEECIKSKSSSVLDDLINVPLGPNSPDLGNIPNLGNITWTNTTSTTSQANSNSDSSASTTTIC